MRWVVASSKLTHIKETHTFQFETVEVEAETREEAKEKARPMISQEINPITGKPHHIMGAFEKE